MYKFSTPVGFPQATPARPLQGGRAFRWPANAGLQLGAPKAPQALLGGLGGSLDRGFAPQVRRGNLQDLRADLAAAEATQASPEDRAAAARAVRLAEAARAAEKASNEGLRALGLPTSPLTAASPVDRAILAQDARVQAAEARLLAASQPQEKAPSRAVRALEDRLSSHWALLPASRPEAPFRALRAALDFLKTEALKVQQDLEALAVIRAVAAPLEARAKRLQEQRHAEQAKAQGLRRRRR